MFARRVRALLATVVLLAAVAACSQYSEQPARVTVQPDASRLMPADVPDGLRLSRVDTAPDAYSGGLRATLYAEPEAGLNPTRLLAGFYDGQDESAGRAGVPGPGDTERGFTANGVEYDVFSYGSDRWITWSVKIDTGTYQNFGMLGRDLSERELRAAAVAARTTSDGTVVVPSFALPTGFTSVGSAEVALPEAFFVSPDADDTLLNSPLNIGFHTLWSQPGSDRRIEFGFVRYDEQLAQLVAGMVSGDAKQIRGASGRAGYLSSQLDHVEFSDAARVWVWREGDALAIAVARGLSDAEIERTVASLRPVGEAELDRLTASMTPDELFEHPDTQVLSSGRWDKRGSWAVGSRTANGGEASIDEVVCRAETGSNLDCNLLHDGGSDASPEFPATLPTAQNPLVRVAQASGLGSTSHPIRSVWAVHDTVARVRVSCDGGGEKSPTLSDAGPAGVRWFSLATTLGDGGCSVTALRSDGGLMATKLR